MQDPDAHYRIVYTGRDGHRIVSMTHMRLDKAESLASLVNRRARLGSFAVEDENDNVQRQAA